jgi:hypothetical protein
MPTEMILMIVCIMGFAVAQSAALLVFGIFAPKYIRFHSGRIRQSSKSFILWSGLYIDDYNECRRIAKEMRRKPQWLRWFEYLECIAIGFFVAMPLWFAIGALWKL